MSIKVSAYAMVNCNKPDTALDSDVMKASELEGYNAKYEVENLSNGKDYDFDNSVALALTDECQRGFEITNGEDVDYLTPLATVKEYVIPELEKLFTRPDIYTHSVSVMFEGENYIARVRVSQGLTLKNQQTKRMGRVIWNYAIISDTGNLASLVIATRKAHQHSKRNK